ncbi:MAG: FAD:protein FMN transferase [Gemmataceae bacterium]|nr:FAD:protein FMN transferase [Gemmataceae bacterium]MDW8264581.1 FAD:protein FMN transferase [Gemmataceae bacterium]
MTAIPRDLGLLPLVGVVAMHFLSGSAAGQAAEPALERHTFAEPHMGTRFKIILYAPDQATAQQAARAAFARVAELDRIMSDYDAASELMQLCRKAGGPPVRVSEDLFRVLLRAQEMSRRSDGAFDVTIGPVVKLWRRSRKTLRLPEPTALRQALELVGHQRLRLDESTRSVQLLQPGMQLDLGGIAKGYAADAAQQVLRKHGIHRALVAAGGDIVVSGPPPEAPRGWTIGITPLDDDPTTPPKRYLTLQNAAVSTSGDAEQYVEIECRRYSHIVDPRTGIGLVGRVSATVVARDGTTADSLATALVVLGPDKGMPVIDATEGAAALFIRKTEAGEEARMSQRFSQLAYREEAR